MPTWCLISEYKGEKEREGNKSRGKEWDEKKEMGKQRVGALDIVGMWESGIAI